MEATLDKCLAFYQTLAMSNLKFSLNLTIGRDNFNFNNKKQAISFWQKLKKKSPSQIRREALRKEKHEWAAAEKATIQNDAEEATPSHKMATKGAGTVSGNGSNSAIGNTVTQNRQF